MMNTKHLEKLKTMVNTKETWDAFCEEVDVNLDLVHRRFEQTQDTNELFRLQGEARAYRSLKLLRDKVNG
jgi:hypothetical protein